MSNLQKLQFRMLIVNISVAIISLVAALSIIFAPLLSFDLGAVMNGIAEESVAESGESEESSNGYMNAILSSVGEIKISITTYGITNFAFSDDPVNQLVAAAVEQIRAVEKTLITNLAVIFIPQLINENASDLNVSTENLDVEAIVDKFDGVFSAETDAEAEAAIHSLTEEIQRQAISTNGQQLVPDEMLDNVEEIVTENYHKTVETLGGERPTFESFVCVTVSNMLSGGDESAKIYTNYHDLLSGELGISEDDIAGEGSGTLAEFKEIIEIATQYLKYFAIVMWVFAGVWLIQFLFAFIHIFLKNKCFTMWYTKLLGFFPCLLFGVAPLILKKVLASLAGESQIITVIFGAVSTMTWISGACYLLLWIISIFLAFPLKRKIRRAKKEEENS